MYNAVLRRTDLIYIVVIYEIVNIIYLNFFSCVLENQYHYSVSPGCLRIFLIIHF